MVGIALCHTIPRDNTIRVSILLLLIGFVLTAIAIGKRDTSDSAATLQGKIGGVHTVYGMAADITLTNRDTHVPRCTNAVGSGVNGCDLWVDAMRAVTASILVGFSAVPLCVVAISVVTQVVGTTTNIILASAVCAVVPALTTLFGVAYFFTTAIPQGAKAAGFPRGDYEVERGVSTNLMIAAVTFHCAVLALIVLRIVVALVFLPHWKSTSVADRNIDGVMVMHMANDDWERQQQVWNTHKEFVHKSGDTEEGEEKEENEEKKDSSAFGERHEPVETEDNRSHEPTA